MTLQIARRLSRINLYFRRIQEAMRRNNAIAAMAHAAELAEQARRLYAEFEAENRKREREQSA